jgi:hypothetical protein
MTLPPVTSSALEISGAGIDQKFHPNLIRQGCDQRPVVTILEWHPGRPCIFIQPQTLTEGSGNSRGLAELASTLFTGWYRSRSRSAYRQTVS